MKYIIYTRQSKPSKKTKAILLSHETQKNKCLSVIPADAEKLFVDDPSGADNNVMKRKVFMKTLEEVKKGDVFVVYKLDRICRDFYQMGFIKTTIEMKGAILLSATEQDIDRTMMGFTAVMADSQKQQIRARTKDALSHLKSLGYRVGRIPYGYTLGSDQKVIKNDFEQNILNKMELFRNQGLTLYAIAQRLNADGILNRGGGPWSHVSIHKILKNAPNHRAVY